MRRRLPLVRLLPNVVTILAICAGLTAIRFGVTGEPEIAVKLILVACVLDGLDGRLARSLKSETKIGAELDSLADFLNFGVAPSILLYFWALQDSGNTGWIAVLFFVVCCGVRLARFNVDSRAPDAPAKSTHFVGVPSPAGACLVLLPMVASFALDSGPLVPDLAIGIYMAAMGLLLISRLRTPSLKGLTVSPEDAKFLLVGAVALVGLLVVHTWIVLMTGSVLYLLGLAWLSRRGLRKGNHGKE